MGCWILGTDLHRCHICLGWDVRFSAQTCTGLTSVWDGMLDSQHRLLAQVSHLFGMGCCILSTDLHRSNICLGWDVGFSAQTCTSLTFVWDGMLDSQHRLLAQVSHLFGMGCCILSTDLHRSNICLRWDVGFSALTCTGLTSVWDGMLDSQHRLAQVSQLFGTGCWILNTDLHRSHICLGWDIGFSAQTCTGLTSVWDEMLDSQH